MMSLADMRSAGRGTELVAVLVLVVLSFCCFCCLSVCASAWRSTGVGVCICMYTDTCDEIDG